MSIPATQLTQPDGNQLAKEVSIIYRTHNEVIFKISNADRNADRNADATYSVSVNNGLYSVALNKNFHTTEPSTRRFKRGAVLDSQMQQSIGFVASKKLVQEVTNQLFTYLCKALYTACAIGDCKSLETLLSQGINVNLQDPNNYLCAPLFIAAKYGHLKCVKLLVESGAKKDIKNDEDATPLMTATFRGHHEIVEYLIDKGASPDSFTAGLKMTPVMYAAKAGHSACVAKLLPKSQDIGKQNASGNTALMIASEKGYEAVVNIILMHENSSDWINTENQDGNTALSLAAVNGRCGIVTLLLNNDARTDILNKGNQTAYQRALWNGKNACVQVIKNHVSTPIDSIFRDGIELTVKQYDEV